MLFDNSDHARSARGRDSVRLDIAFPARMCLTIRSYHVGYGSSNFCHMETVMASVTKKGFI